MSRQTVPAWVCEEADVLVGEVVDFGVGTGRYGAYMMLVVDVSEGTERGEPLTPGTRRAVHCSARTLASAVERLRPRIGYGDYVTIRRRGQAVTKDGQRTYTVFELERERSRQRTARQATAERRFERQEQRRARQGADEDDASGVERRAWSQIGANDPWPEDMF